MSENEGEKNKKEEFTSDAPRAEPSPTPEIPQVAHVSPLSDEAKMAEIETIYKVVNESLKKAKETEEVMEINNLLKRISANIRKYEKEEKVEKSYLDEAYEAARLALIKKNTIIREKEDGFSLARFSVMGGLFWVFIGWVIIRLIFGFIYSEGIFILDAFFVAFIAAMVSAIVYLGKSVAIETDSFKTFATLAASPFVAVALIVLFSELAIGVGGEITSSGVTSDIIAFTLKGASSELKLGFAFLFGFFGEISIEILKNVMKSVTGRE